MTAQEMETIVKALTAPGSGVAVNRATGQQALPKRARLSGAARQGKYTAAMEQGR
jgi:hypothetical protein